MNKTYPKTGYAHLQTAGQGGPKSSERDVVKACTEPRRSTRDLEAMDGRKTRKPEGYQPGWEGQTGICEADMGDLPANGRAGSRLTCSSEALRRREPVNSFGIGSKIYAALLFLMSFHFQLVSAQVRDMPKAVQEEFETKLQNESEALTELSNLTVNLDAKIAAIKELAGIQSEITGILDKKNALFQKYSREKNALEQIRHLILEASSRIEQAQSNQEIENILSNIQTNLADAKTGIVRREATNELDALLAELDELLGSKKKFFERQRGLKKKLQRIRQKILGASERVAHASNNREIETILAKVRSLMDELKTEIKLFEAQSHKSIAQTHTKTNKGLFKKYTSAMKKKEVRSDQKVNDKVFVATPAAPIKPAYSIPDTMKVSSAQMSFSSLWNYVTDTLKFLGSANKIIMSLITLSLLITLIVLFRLR